MEDDKLFLDLATGKLRMMAFDSGTFFKARLHSEFADESTHRVTLPDLGIAQPGREAKDPRFAGALATDASGGCQAASRQGGRDGPGMVMKWESASGPANSPHHPPCPGLGLELVLGQPARHKQTPMAGAEVALLKLCEGCFASQARKSLGCSTPLGCFGLTMSFWGQCRGEGRKRGLPLSMGGLFPSM